MKNGAVAALNAAMMTELKAALGVAQVALAAHDSATASDAVDRAYLLGVGIENESEKPQQKPRRAAGKRRNRKATAARSRTPAAQSRSAVLEILGKTEGTMTVREIAEQTGLTTSAVKRGVESIDGDLLQVVQERRTAPAQYSLKSMREEVLA